MPSFCCAECFGDHGLRRSVIPSRTEVHGKCDFCKATDVDLVAPNELSAEFEMLTSIYEIDPDGRLLVEWLKDDWSLFPKLDIANAKSLLAEVMDDGDIVRKTFTPSLAFKSEGLVAWNTLRDELMYKNRYFLDEALDKDRLGELLSHLTISELPEIWYRARITVSDIGYTIDQMGAPPRELASHGRANPSGIPYLYLGSAPDTAIAEIRPHTGETASVAQFTLQGAITVVDLRNPAPCGARTLTMKKKHRYPLAALYTLLEEETAKNFEDQSLPGVVIDASRVIFILIANDGSLLPSPILSRVQRYYIDPPTPSQQRQVLKRIFAGILGKLDVSFDDELCAEIIEDALLLSPRAAKVRLEISVAKSLAADRNALDFATWMSTNRTNAVAKNKIGFY